MSHKKSKRGPKKSETSIQNSGDSEMFVLPPDLLEKLGILSAVQNLSPEPPILAPVRRSKRKKIKTEHSNVCNVLEKKNETNDVSGEPKNLSNTQSSMLETADLMRESVFLSPTFIPPTTPANIIDTEIELSCSLGYPDSVNNDSITVRILHETTHTDKNFDFNNDELQKLYDAENALLNSEKCILDFCEPLISCNNNIPQEVTEKTNVSPLWKKNMDNFTNNPVKSLPQHDIPLVDNVNFENSLKTMLSKESVISETNSNDMTLRSLVKTATTVDQVFERQQMKDKMLETNENSLSEENDRNENYSHQIGNIEVVANTSSDMEAEKCEDFSATFEFSNIKNGVAENIIHDQEVIEIYDGNKITETVKPLNIEEIKDTLNGCNTINVLMEDHVNEGYLSDYSNSKLGVPANSEALLNNKAKINILVDEVIEPNRLSDIVKDVKFKPIPVSKNTVLSSKKNNNSSDDLKFCCNEKTSQQMFGNQKEVGFCGFDLGNEQNTIGFTDFSFDTMNLTNEIMAPNNNNTDNKPVKIQHLSMNDLASLETQVNDHEHFKNLNYNITVSEINKSDVENVDNNNTQTRIENFKIINNTKTTFLNNDQIVIEFLDESNVNTDDYFTSEGNLNFPLETVNIKVSNTDELLGNYKDGTIYNDPGNMLLYESKTHFVPCENTKSDSKYKASSDVISVKTMPLDSHALSESSELCYKKTEFAAIVSDCNQEIFPTSCCENTAHQSFLIKKLEMATDQDNKYKNNFAKDITDIKDNCVNFEKDNQITQSCFKISSLSQKNYCLKDYEQLNPLSNFRNSLHLIKEKPNINSIKQIIDPITISVTKQDNKEINYEQEINDALKIVKSRVTDCHEIVKDSYFNRASFLNQNADGKPLYEIQLDRKKEQERSSDKVAEIASYLEKCTHLLSKIQKSTLNLKYSNENKFTSVNDVAKPNLDKEGVEKPGGSKQIEPDPNNKKVGNINVKTYKRSSKFPKPVKLYCNKPLTADELNKITLSTDFNRDTAETEEYCVCGDFGNMIQYGPHQDLFEHIHFESKSIGYNKDDLLNEQNYVEYIENEINKTDINFSQDETHENYESICWHVVGKSPYSESVNFNFHSKFNVFESKQIIVDGTPDLVADNDKIANITPKETNKQENNSEKTDIEMTFEQKNNADLTFPVTNPNFEEESDTTITVLVVVDDTDVKNTNTKENHINPQNNDMNLKNNVDYSDKTQKDTTVKDVKTHQVEVEIKSGESDDIIRKFRRTCASKKIKSGEDTQKRNEEVIDANVENPDSSVESIKPCIVNFREQIDDDSMTTMIEVTPDIVFNEGCVSTKKVAAEIGENKNNSSTSQSTLDIKLESLIATPTEEKKSKPSSIANCSQNDAQSTDVDNMKVNAASVTVKCKNESSTEKLRMKRKRSIANTSQNNVPPTEQMSKVIESRANSEKQVRCGVCREGINTTQWADHASEKHCYVAWQEGQSIDLQTEGLLNNLNTKVKGGEKLKCTFCSKEIKSTRNFLSHVKKCLEEFKCSRSDASISVELNDERVNSLSSLCGVCHEVVSNESWFEHIEEKHNYLAWKDGETPVDLNQRKDVKRHVQSLLEQYGYLNCPKCRSSFTNINPFKNHVKECKQSKLSQSVESHELSDDNQGNDDHNDCGDDDNDEEPLKNRKSYGRQSKCEANDKGTRKRTRRSKISQWPDDEDNPKSKEAETENKSNAEESEPASKKKYKSKKKINSSTPVKIETEVKMNQAPVKCGVCQMEVEPLQWLQHIQSAHNYLAWTSNEPRLNLEDPESVQNHLIALSRKNNGLTCSKCGSVRKYPKSYLNHVGTCEGVVPTSSADASNASLINVTAISEPETDTLCTSTQVTCAVCSLELKTADWEKHNLKKHYNLAWPVDGEPIDLKNATVVERYLKVYKSQTKTMVCNVCGASRASCMGFYAHVLACGRTETEIEEFKELCEVCNQKYLCIYRQQHFAGHKVQEETKERKRLAEEEAMKLKSLSEINTTLNGENTLNNSGRRKAAEKARSVIENYSTAFQYKHACPNCDFATDDKKKMQTHRCKEKADAEQSDSDTEDTSEEEEIESDEDSAVDSDVSEELDPVELAKAKKRIQKKSYLLRPQLKVPFAVRDNKKFVRSSANDFLEMHYAADNLFVDWRKIVLEPVTDDSLHKYLPPLEESCKVMMDVDWTSYKRFEACIHKKGYSFFTGGSPQCVAWAPPRYKTEDCNKNSNYLAVSCHRGADSPRLAYNQSYVGTSMIQIWDLALFEDFLPKLVLGIAHDWGTVWAMEWCPSGTREPLPETIDGTPVRLGLLAVACSNGVAYILSVPNPATLPVIDKLFYKLKPVAELRLHRELKSYQATSLSWSKQKEHAVVIVGYSNGTAAMYDLGCASPLTREEQNGVTIIYPYHDERVHATPVTGVSLFAGTDPAVDTGLVTISSPTGVTLSARGTAMPARIAIHNSVKDVSFLPLWPSVFMSEDVIGNSELDWFGTSRRFGVARAGAGCDRCGSVLTSAPPLLRLMYGAHKVFTDTYRRNVMSIDMEPITQTRVKQRTNNNFEMQVEPLSYEDAIEKYGLRVKFLKGRDAVTQEPRPERFPLADVTSVAFCPSPQYHNRVAIATHAGIVLVVTV